MSDQWFGSIETAVRELRRVGYLADESTATSAFLAGRMNRPLLIEGPAGTGKTDLARAVAESTGRPLVRLQCYEGLDEAKVLYEWNYRKQLLWLQADRRSSAGLVADDGSVGEPAEGQDPNQGGQPADWENIFSEAFLLERPIMQAIRSKEPVVLLIDEVDRIEMETEALLLEVLSDFRVTIPEMGTISAETRPFTILTSNATRELSEALKRRCLYLWLDYPSLEREKTIVMSRVPDMEEKLAADIVRVVRSLRTMDLKKAPSIAETLDWAQTLLELGINEINGEAVAPTLGSLLKHPADIDKARTERFTE